MYISADRKYKNCFGKTTILRFIWGIGGREGGGEDEVDEENIILCSDFI